MKTRQFWYPLPERLIAQHPAERRGTEKMMVLHRDTGVIEHRHIADIVEYMTPNDLLVVNDTKVFPARLIGRWPDSGGAVEVLMVNAAPMDGGDEVKVNKGRIKIPLFTLALHLHLWNLSAGTSSSAS